MNALAMPISSRTAEDMLSAWCCTKSPRILEERCATSCATRASSSFSLLAGGCISHDPIIAKRSLRSAGIVQVMQMGYRLAHGEEGLVQIQRPAEQDAEQLGRALRRFQRRAELGQPIPVMGLQRCHALVRSPERLAVRRQDQHVVG